MLRFSGGPASVLDMTNPTSAFGMNQARFALRYASSRRRSWSAWRSKKRSRQCDCWAHRAMPTGQETEQTAQAQSNSLDHS